MLNINYWKHKIGSTGMLYINSLVKKTLTSNHTESDSYIKKQCIEKRNVKLKGGKLKKGSIKRLISLKKG